jgi:hypothetical protein
MTSTKPLTASERYARFVLGAWNKREFVQLRTVLRELPFAQPETLPSEERERVDLIRDLGQNLLMQEGAGRTEDESNQNAALGILRRLARYE